MATPACLEDVLDVSELTGRAAITRLVYIAQHAPDSNIGGQAALTAIPIIKSSTLDTDTYMSVVDLYLNKYHSQADSSGGQTADIPSDRMDVDNGATSLAKSPTSGSILSSSVPPVTSISSFSMSKAMGSADAKIEESGQPDVEWCKEAASHALSGKMKLEAELKQYQSNLIKESCRLTYHSIAAHQRKTGELQGALKTYAKAREFNSNAQHELECALGIIEVSLEIGAYTQTLPAIIKAETALDRIVGVRGLTATGSASRGLGPADGSAQVLTGAQSRERDQKLRELDENRTKSVVKLKAAKGVASMGVGLWEQAAREFMTIDGKLEDWEGKVLAPSDIAIYLSLTALATLSRSTIKTSILDNADLRYFLDCDSAGHAREMLSSFVDAKYKRLLTLLLDHEWQHRLNPHLASQLSGLTSAIRQRSLVQYFEPFESVDLSRMSEAFGATTQFESENLIQELAELIKRGRMLARLDMIDKVLQAVKVNPRQELYTRVLRMGEQMDAASRKAHLRMKLIESNVTVDVPGQKRKDRKDRGDGDYGDGDEDFGDVGGAVTQEEEDIQMATAMSLNAHERE